MKLCRCGKPVKFANTALCEDCYAYAMRNCRTRNRHLESDKHWVSREKKCEDEEENESVDALDAW